MAGELTADVVVDEAGNVVMATAGLEAILGRSPEQVLDQPFDLLLVPESRSAAARQRSELLAGPGSERSTSRHLGLCSDGRSVPIEVTLSRLAARGGRFVGAVIRGGSDPQTSDAVALRLAGLVESAQDAIISADLEGRIDSWNPAAERLFGYSAAEAIGRPATFLKPVALQGQSGDKIARLRQGDIVPPAETVRRTKDGRDIEVSITHSTIRDVAGTVIGTSIVVRDLTGQRSSEATRFHLASVIEHSGAAIMATDLDGRITSWNAAAERLFGFSVDEVLGRPSSLLMPTDLESAAVPWDRIRAGDVVPPYDTVRLRKDGATLDVSVSSSVIRDASGAIVGYSAFYDDIRERKQAERALSVAHEAALVASREYEAFAYAVAHDLRTPLRGIAGFVHLGRQQYEAGHPEAGRIHLDRVRASAEEMGRLINSLLGLAQVTRQPLSTGPVDLSALAESAIERLQDEFPAREVETVVQSGICAVGDAALLSNLLTNLLANAWKFTGRQPHARIEFGYEAGHYFVTDNGAGFDMAHYDKMFGLFQRLHHQSDYEGTGIGLATSQRIIRRHGGRIWAEGTVGHGSTFSFTVPS